MTQSASASVNSEQRKLTIQWSGGESKCFHYVWLRHSGRCPQGMPNDTSIKIDLLPDDPAALRIEGFKIENDTLSIQWRDNVKTDHELSTLRRYAYDTRSRQLRKSVPVLWDAGSAKDIPVFEHSALSDPQSLLRIQLAVRDYELQD